MNLSICNLPTNLNSYLRILIRTLLPTYLIRM